MTRRLTLFFTLSVFCLLAVASLYLYVEMAINIDRDSRDQLNHKVQVLTRLIQESPPNLAGIEQEAHEEAEVSADSRSPFFLRVLDARGEVVVATPAMDTLLPAGTFPERGLVRPQPRRWLIPADASFLLSSSTAVEGQGGELWRIQAAIETSSAEELLAGFRRNIAFVLLGGLCIAAAMGFWLVRRSLRPLQDIAIATELVEAQQLDRRINAGHWPAELDTVATAYDRMLDRLQDSFVRLQQFSADLAHELRTPINNLMGESQVALSRQRSEADYVRVLQSSLEELSRIARIIDSMLFLAQADQARTEPQLASLDAQQELRAVGEFYQALADERGVHLQFEGEGRVRAEPLLLRRAISNLLANALRYTNHGGYVVLRVTCNADGAVALSVSDSGVGIDPAHLPKLGDRFYRVDPSRAEGSSGSGLGLAIVKSIMALHKGKMRIDSVPGTGTTVALVFPPAHG